MALVLITGSCGLVGSESSMFFAKKGFEILGIDNNSRRSFFGKDGDINWIKNKLKKNIKNYKHSNLDIRDYKGLEKIFKKYKKNIKVKHVKSKLINQYSYKISNKKFSKKAFILKSNIEPDIKTTLTMFKYINEM